MTEPTRPSRWSLANAMLQGLDPDADYTQRGTAARLAAEFETTVMCVRRAWVYLERTHGELGSGVTTEAMRLYHARELDLRGPSEVVAKRLGCGMTYARSLRRIVRAYESELMKSVQSKASEKPNDAAGD